MKTLIAAAAIFLTAGATHAQDVTRAYPAPDAPIAGTVVVPPGYSTVYLSGLVPDVTHPEAEKGSVAAYGTTEEQTESVLGKIRTSLQAQGLDFKDVVSMHVYLVGDPAMGGKMDFGGMMESYKTFFGTPEQPNKPSRITSQIVSLVQGGMLVEIEVQAARKPK